MADEAIHTAIQQRLLADASPFALDSLVLNGHRLAVYRHAPETLLQVLDEARGHGEAPFIKYLDSLWTFADFTRGVDSLAAWLLAQGVVAGDRVAIAMRNRPEWAVAFMAAVRIGALPAPLNSFGQGDELRQALAYLEPAVLCCDRERLDRLAGQTGVPGCRLVVAGNDEGLPLGEAASFESALSAWPEPRLPEVRVDPDSPALILFTSGATSRPKGVVSSHRAVGQALFNIDFIGALSGMTSPEAVKRIEAQRRPSVTLTAVPLFHVSGLHAQLLTAMRHGRQLIFMHRWNAVDALALMRSEGVTQFNGAPSMVRQLVMAAEERDDDILEGLWGMGFGGSGVPDSLLDKVLSRFPEQMVGIGFGMTETNGAVSAVSGALFRGRPRSSGALSPLFDVQILAPDGEALPAGEVGEVCVRGVTLMQGYWREPEATARALEQGWLRTGDLGYLDAEGFLFIVDRLKDVIVRSGENIAPAEIESCLTAHPAVAEAAVFGIPDEETGEAVAAMVALREGEWVEESELQAHVRHYLAGYKVPSAIRIRHDALLRNPAGKLLKKHLREDFLQDTAQLQ